MAGDVKIAVVGRALAESSTGTADFTKVGFGTPEACIIIATLDITNDTSVFDESIASIGFSDFTSDYCIAHQDDNSSSKVDCDAYKSNTYSYYLFLASGTVRKRGTASAITDGVRLTNSLGTFVSFATVIMFGGADLAVSLQSSAINSSADGTATISHSGFTDGNDKLIFFIGSDISGEDSASSGINNSFGVCHATGSDGGGWTFSQRSIGWASDHNATEGAPHAEITNDRVLNIITEAGGEDWGLEVTDLEHTTDTWEVTTRDNGAGAGMEVYSLALDLSDRSAAVFDTTLPTSGATWSPSLSLSFIPQYVGLGLTGLSTISDRSVGGTIASDATAGPMGISSNAGSGEETCHSFYNAYNTVTTDTANLFRSRVIDFRDDDTATVEQDHSHLSFDSGGFTTTINTVNGSADIIMGWAIETNEKPSETFTALSDGILGTQNFFAGPFEI
jgi:hypothetical protein